MINWDRLCESISTAPTLDGTRLPEIGGYIFQKTSPRMHQSLVHVSNRYSKAEKLCELQRTRMVRVEARRSSSTVGRIKKLVCVEVTH